ncbi:hypothetical protein VPHD520_0085 [Vibrio phage D520]
MKYAPLLLVLSFFVLLMGLSFFTVLNANFAAMNQCKAQFVGMELGAHEVADRCKNVPTISLIELIKDSI